MQRRSLVRASGLASFRRVLSAIALAGDARAVRRRVVIVPTHAAAELLRQTIERDAVGAGGAIVLPDLLTRDRWLADLATRVAGARPLLTRLEREILLERAARHVVETRPRVIRPFHLRPSLVAALLDFYDELGRRERTVRRFVRGLFDELRVERGVDRGSDSLIDQTCFLGFTFLAYERAVAAAGRLDEHALARVLVATQPDPGFDELVIAVADHPADPSGLWPADFNLAGRLERIRHVCVVMTDESHDAGFRDRLERELPGIEETRAPDAVRSPMLVVPGEPADALVFASRDREEELRDVVRVIRTRAADEPAVSPDRVAVVFHRPLPYLYLAQHTLSEARLPYQAFDALPLAAEPYAALMDLAMTVARTGGTREATVALLRSSGLRFETDGYTISLRDVSALEAVLLERRAAGDAASYPEEVAAFFGTAATRDGLVAAAAGRAASAGARAAAALETYRTGPTASAQLRALSGFLCAHERRLEASDDRAERHRRARAAVLGVLDALADACGRHDDRPRPHDDLSALIHHAIEARTFSPRLGPGGVHLVDAVAAKFGEFDDVYVVGLADTDWSPRQRRNVFYSTGLLRSLGWPQDTDQNAAAEAAFLDLLALPRLRTRLSAFDLDGDAVVARSPLLELARGRASIVEPPIDRGRLFPDELLAAGVLVDGLGADAEAWLAARRERPDLASPAYAGEVGARAAGTYRVSHVDTYAVCPFKYFAAHVLRLREERDEVAGLTPLERGTLLHSLFESFYRAWDARGAGAIRRETLPDAVALFSAIANDALAALPQPDGMLERMRLLGSLVGRGVAERVFEAEVASGAAVRHRLLEQELDGEFVFPVDETTSRSIRIRGKADRIDLLDDGALRVVDYKLGRMPDIDRSVQVAVYAHCAQQVIEAADGRRHPIAAAMYLAFGDDRKLEGRLGRGAAPDEPIVEARARAFAAMVARIEAGQFPADPAHPTDCQWCGVAGVCRKEYRRERETTADAV